jgi:hypothetical protein
LVGLIGILRGRETPPKRVSLAWWASLSGRNSDPKRHGAPHRCREGRDAQMPCVLSSVPLCGFSGAAHRLTASPVRGVGVLLVLAQRLPYHHQHQEDETLYHRRDLRHVELVPVPPRQERGLERVRPASPVLPLRLEDRREKILYVVGRLNVARAQEILFPSVPEPVRLARLEVDRLSPGPANRGGSPARL